MPSSTTTALSRRPLKEVLEGVADPRDRRGVRHALTAVTPCRMQLVMVDVDAKG